MPYGVCDECWRGHHERCTGCPCKMPPVVGVAPLDDREPYIGPVAGDDDPYVNDVIGDQT